MGIPPDLGIIDTMIGFPRQDESASAHYAYITQQTRDHQSKEEYAFPVEFMYKSVPESELAKEGDPVSVTLREMDRFGIERGLVGIDDHEGMGVVALRRHPDRFVASCRFDPNGGMEALRKLVHDFENFNVRAVECFPAGTFPQVPINDKKMYPLYAKCIELGIAVFCIAGVPGPRLKMAAQHVELIDEVMYDFPELTFVARHGCEPWTELMCTLMLKWPGLHYSTSSFAPKYYPSNVIDFANTRGADQIIYGGYFPMGLTLERIMSEMPNVPFRDPVWPKFLRGNAVRVLGLDSTDAS